MAVVNEMWLPMAARKYRHLSTSESPWFADWNWMCMSLWCAASSGNVLVPILVSRSEREASKSDARKVLYRTRKWSIMCWHEIETSPKDGLLSSSLSASGKLVMMLLFNMRRPYEMAAFRRKEISYCFKIAATAPSSGGGVKMMVGRSAIMKSPMFIGSASVTPGSVAHWASETQNPSSQLIPKCSWHLLPKAVLMAIREACMCCLVFTLMSGSTTSVI